MIMVCTAALAQKTASGQVLDEFGEGVPGAGVVVKGTKIGTTTDVNGNFTLSNIPSNAKELEFSFLGYKTSVMPIAAKMTVTLEPDAEMLENAVVTGMTSIDRRLFTGASSTLNANDMKISGMADISRSLEGRAAGVSVQNVSGTFGTAPKIRVRGATSIYGSSKPLWVVDGVIMDDVIDISADDLSSGDATTLIGSAIAGLNAEDIESFTILKDGSATSIYGAKAMAGVIVITTKKGQAGVHSISYTSELTYRMTPLYSEFNIMNSQDQMSIYKEMEDKGWLNNAAVSNGSSGGIYRKMYDLVNSGQLLNTDAARNAWLRQAEYRNTDWFGELFNKNVMHTHSVSLQSGTDKSNYYASISAMFDPGWTKASKVQRYTANLNATYKIFKDLSFNMITNASYRQQSAPGTLSANIDAVSGEVKRDFDINPYSYALNTSRALDPEEYYVRSYAPFNILHELNTNYIDLGVVDTKFQGELKWKAFKGFEARALASVRYSATMQEHHITDDSNQASAYRAMPTTIIRDNNRLLYKDPDDPYAIPVSILPNGGIYDRFDNNMLSYNYRFSASYNTEIQGKHIINLYGGTEINQSDRHKTWFRGWGMQYSMGEVPFYAYEVFKRGSEEGTDYYSLSNLHYRNAAFFANGTYSYRGRYTLNGTYRYEGNNRLGRSRSARWLPTWNIAGTWNVHEEEFFKNLKPALSHLSLKGSYSLTADAGPSYVSNASVEIASNTPWRPSAGVTETGLEIASLANTDLTYEKKHELNLGFDMGFLDNRINLTFDWYKRNNFDLIGIVTTQGIGGEVRKYGNSATMESNGYEISLSTKNIEKKNFTWTTDIIFSHTKNLITKLETTKRGIDFVTGTGFGREGYDYRSIFSYQFKGLNEDGIPILVNELGQLTSNAAGTELNTINFQDRENFDHLVYRGPADPTDFGSLGNTFKVYGFRLNVFLTYSFGNVVRLDPVFSSSYSDLDAMPREFANRWMVPGDEQYTTVPAIVSKRQMQNYTSSYLSRIYNAYNYSTERIAKGDFIRLKEVSVSYDIPKKVISKAKLQSLSLKLQATNLALLYCDKKLNGQDPEFFNTGGVASPVPRQFTLTIRLGL